MENRQFKSKSMVYSWKILLSLLLIYTGCFSVVGQTSVRMSKHLPGIEQWIEEHFAEGKIPPFSFVYDGQPSESFIEQWKYSAEKLTVDEPDVVEYIFTYINPTNGLSVICNVKGYPDYHGVEWVLNFTNKSPENSREITNVNVCDLSIQYPTEGAFHLHYS